MERGGERERMGKREREWLFPFHSIQELYLGFVFPLTRGRAFFSVEDPAKEPLVLWGSDGAAAATVRGNNAQVPERFFSWQFTIKYSHVPRGIKSIRDFYFILVSLSFRSDATEKAAQKGNFCKGFSSPFPSF